MRKKLLVAAITTVIAISLVAYAWTVRNQDARIEKDQEGSSDVTGFEAVVNGIESMNVSVCVNISDGLTETEAELIVGTTFILVLGDYVTHRLDSLTFDDTRIEAHYTWGYDKNDSGHICEITADLTTLKINVDHCL